MATTTKDQLWEFVSNGDLSGMQTLLAASISSDEERKELLNSRFDQGQTLLHRAVDRNQISVISWLLLSEPGGGRAAGFSSVIDKSDDGHTALHLAAAEGHLEAVEALVFGCVVETGEQFQLLNAVDNAGKTVLHIAASHGHDAILSWILSDNGGRRDGGLNSLLARTSRGSTAIHIAAEHGHLSCIQALVNGSKVENGEREELLNAVDCARFTALHIAAHHSRSSVISWLLSEEEGGGREAGFNSILARGVCEFTALQEAVGTGSVVACLAVVDGCKVENGEREEMLNAVDDAGWTILHIAAFHGHLAFISWLLSEDGGLAAGFRRSNLFALTLEKESVLHCSASSGSSDRFDLLLSLCFTSAERLRLFLGVEKHGWTIFHVAAVNNKPQFISHLLHRYPEESQLILNLRDLRGLTVLQRAIIKGIDDESREEWKMYRSGEYCVQALLETTTTTIATTEVEEKKKVSADPNLGVKFL